MKINISDICYINDAARAFKQRSFMWISNMLISMDNMICLSICYLEISKLSILPIKGLIINQRELSKFVKNITTEHEFFIDDNIITGSIMLHTISETLVISFSKRDDIFINNLINNTKCIPYDNYPEEYMTDRLQQLYTMSKSSGMFTYQYDAKHILTLFSSMIPLNKADKLHMTLIDAPDGTFYVRFRVVKKSFAIYIYIRYLQI